MSSLVNTLLNWLFKTSAFSASLVALVPSSFCRSGMVALVVLLSFTYLQKTLLLFLISLEMFLSKASLSLLILDVGTILVEFAGSTIAVTTEPVK